MHNTQYDPTAAALSITEPQSNELSLSEVATVDDIAAALSGTSDPTSGKSAHRIPTNGDVITPSPMRTAPEAGATPAQPMPIPQAIPTPIPIPIPIKRAAKGRYRSSGAGFQLELRVDVDGLRPTKQISGDFFQLSGGTTAYFGSFSVPAPVITVSSTTITIKGLGKFSWTAGWPVVQVTIARHSIFQPAAPAVVQFFNTAGSPGASYLCDFQSGYFRTVRIETDKTSDLTTPVFTSYNTGSLPSGGAARNLSVVSAYAEAGIEMIPTTGTDVINISEAGANAAWSNAELHASMVKHFSLWVDRPQWAVWQVVCQLHEMGTGLYGIMFDQQGKQRQGCAVFHAGIGGTTADKQRLQLYTYVHELGHCFNLLHSWQKSYATPPGTNQPSAMSWMNYPWNFPGGAAAFWNAFPFQFDDTELAHLRHAFYNNIIMGGNDFAVGASLEKTEDLATPIQDDSGLQFEISAVRSFALGEPVVIRLCLATTDTRGKLTHPHLHPNFGLVQVAIRKPSGQIVAYDPFIDHCIIPQQMRLAGGEVLEDSAYIGFGRDGHYFDQPGRYQVRAIYSAPDGSRVASNILPVWVSYPVTQTDEELAQLLLGDEQGALFSVLGSDSEALKRGNDAFDEILAKYPKHRLAAYPQLVKGINASRQFKTISDEKETRLTVRPAQGKECVQFLTAALESNVLDAVSAEMASAYLADAHTGLGEVKVAAKIRQRVRATATRSTAALKVPAPRS
jgi:hypothetical protein